MKTDWKKELKDYIANNMSNKVSYKVLHIFETYQENTTPSEMVCQKGMAYEQTGYGASVYLKTDTECIDTDIIIGGE